MSGSAGRSTTSTRLAILAAAMLARAVANGAFAVWLLVRPPGWDDVFRVGSLYALADGAAALLTAILINAHANTDSVRILGGITFADAVARLAGGACLRVLPGLSSFPVATVSFFGVIGLGTATLGIIALGLWLIARVRAGGGWSKHADALFDPLAATALISFVVGYILFLNPPDTAEALRNLAVGATVALTLVFLVAFSGAITHRLSHR